MWVVLNNSFVSIVEHRTLPNVLVVRGRFRGDVARFLDLPIAVEQETPDADYRFRIQATREDVALRLVEAVGGVRYPNFKDSIREKWRKSVASSIWGVLWNAQEDRIAAEQGFAPALGSSDSDVWEARL